MSVIDEPHLVTTGPAPSEDRLRAPSFEVWSWYFMRISGLALLFLALGHFALTHLIHDVAKTNANFVQQRWKNPMWRIYDWLLLALGLFHGVNGLRYIMDDYIRTPAKRGATKAVVYCLTTGLFLYGTLTVITYRA